ncbi:hypothetical protein [Streptomyces roseolus]
MADPYLLTTSTTASKPKFVGTEWDVIRAPRSIGLLALDILDARSGAVIEDEKAFCWLFPAESKQSWTITNSQVLPAGTTLAVPLARLTASPEPHWQICPGADQLPTTAAALRAALEDASATVAAQPTSDLSAGSAGR